MRLDSQAHYTAGEVAFLLSIPAKIARGMDEGVRCPLGALSDAAGGAPASGDHDGGPWTIARWHDVQAARERVLAAKRDDVDGELLERKLNGDSERAIATATGVSQATVNRRVHVALSDILAELGGEAPPNPDRTSRVPACMKCGQLPRTRVPAVTRHIRSLGVVELKPERQSSLCEPCLTAAIARQLMAAMNQNGAGVGHCV